MSGRPRMSSSGTDFAKRFREFRCIDNYNTFKTEIERKIDDFRSRTKKKFCKECDIIKNLIYQKKNELYSYCDNKSFPNRLIETNDKIKVFIIQCPDLSKCSDNHAPNARKSVAAGKPQLYSCNNGGCVTGRETQLQKDSKAKPEIQRASSEIRGSEGPKALEKNLNPEATAELQKKNVIIPAKHSFTHPGSSAGSDTETPEPKVNTHSRITGHEDTQTHPISLSVPSSASASDTCTIPIPSQSVSCGQPGEGKCSQEKMFVKSDQQNPPHVKQDVDIRALRDPNVSGTIVYNKGINIENFHNVSPADTAHSVSDAILKRDNDKVATNTAADGKEHGSEAIAVREPNSEITVQETSRVAASAIPNVDDEATEVSVDKTRGGDTLDKKAIDIDNPDPELFSGNKITRNDIPAINTDKAATPHKEVYNQKEQPSQNGDHSQTRPHQSMEFKRTKSTFQGSPLHIIPGTRNADGVSTNSLTSSKSSRSDGYSEEVEPSEKYIDEYTSVINLITTYKKYIINTVVPLIIILLLILLMKYTPLRTIFTKKKRKKQNDMNEKIQRVLQQPSTESEQRRIPFSYSAFEYSS